MKGTAMDKDVNDVVNAISIQNWANGGSYVLVPVQEMTLYLRGLAEAGDDERLGIPASVSQYVDWESYTQAQVANGAWRRVSVTLPTEIVERATPFVGWDVRGAGDGHDGTPTHTAGDTTGQYYLGVH
jgi:hypothetical protein